MKNKYKVLTELDFKKKWQTVYTLTPADLRFMLICAGIEKERIEMAHVCSDNHEWLRVTIDDDDGKGFVGVSFPVCGEEEE